MTTRYMSRALFCIAAAGLAAALAPTLAAASIGGNPLPTTAADSTLALAAGEAGTVFGSLTVLGENRVQITFDRPRLDLDLDPHAAAGLEIESALDVLNRTDPDLAGPLLDDAVRHRSGHAPRPWLAAFATERVASFTPNVTDLAHWSLQVVDSAGRSVTDFSGEGNPPPQIVWNGRDSAGEPAPVGLTYSFVFEAVDRAGNRRRFVGTGFHLPAYRLEQEGRGDFVLSGRQWLEDEHALGGDRSAYVLAAAGWFNLKMRPSDPVVIAAAARTRQQADDLGRRAAQALAPWLQGGAERIHIEPTVVADAPDQGTLHLWARRGE